MAKSLLFSSSPASENMFTHSYGKNLFNTRTKDPAAQRPHEPPDEGSRRTKKKRENGLYSYEMWTTLLLMKSRHFRHDGRPARMMGCYLMYTVVSVVRCILTNWN